MKTYKIITELLKNFCLIGLVVNIATDNLNGCIFYGLALIASIIIKELI